MNTRIRELMLEAGYAAPEIAVRAERLAELIVQECIGVIGEENYTMLTGKAYCTELKRHFGVE